MENRDQRGQKEADGEYPALQRGETGQHRAFWPLITRTQLRALVLYWKDNRQIKKKIWGKIQGLPGTTNQTSAYLGGRETSNFQSKCREKGPQLLEKAKSTNSSSVLGFVSQSWVSSGDGSRNPGTWAQDVGRFVVQGRM